MKYSLDIIDKLVAELEKVPNVRYACNKVGIDHSTFYRWMAIHYEFHKAVTGALIFGRENMNSAAEGVIITGIQNNDFRAASFWLKHNHEKYLDIERVRYFQYLEKNEAKSLDVGTTRDYKFQRLFKEYLRLEKELGAEKARDEIIPTLSKICNGEVELGKAFFVAFGEWKLDRSYNYYL